MCVQCIQYVALVIMGSDPALVFSEILGVIKGSREATGTPQRCLDQATYLSGYGKGMLSHTKEVIYALFTAYTKMKQQHQEYDAADRLAPFTCSLNRKWLKFHCRTHHILKEFHDVGWIEEGKGKKVNFLSVYRLHLYQ